MSKDMILKVKNQLETQLEEKMEALPQGMNKTRFTQNALAVLNESKDLQQCSPQSVVIGLMKGAFLGLDFFMKDCYLIKYGTTANFQTDYKGEMKLAKKYSINPIKDIYAKLVREGDVFTEKVVDGKQTVTFEPISFNDGKTIGAFAVAYYEDGSMIYETMSEKEIEETRKNYSKMANSKAWKLSWGEMAKKTVLRRLMKLIEIDFSNNEQAKAFVDGGDLEEKQEKKTVSEVNNFDFLKDEPKKETKEEPKEEIKEAEIVDFFGGEVVEDK